MTMANKLSKKPVLSFHSKAKQAISLGLLALLLIAGCCATCAPAAHASDLMTTPGANPCGDSDDSLYKQMQEANRSYITGAIYKANETYRQHKIASYAQCLIKITGYFNMIETILEMLISLTNTIAGMILALIVKILDFACEYVINGINYLLASACLPIPSLGLDLNFSLPGMPSTSCDGISLLNFIQAQGGFSTNIPYAPYSGGMSLGLDQLIKK